MPTGTILYELDPWLLLRFAIGWAVVPYAADANCGQKKEV